ncbi:hypothetical protein JQ612_28045 [Bradyrhizobium manausense]|nr:hypothetical protein [Bradyrhizobium manausense]
MLERDAGRVTGIMYKRAAKSGSHDNAGSKLSGLSNEEDGAGRRRPQPFPIAAIASAISMVRLAMSACRRSTIAPSRRIAPRETSPATRTRDDFRARDFLFGRGEDRVAGLDLREMDQRLAVNPRSRPCAHSAAISPGLPVTEKTSTIAPYCGPLAERQRASIV